MKNDASLNNNDINIRLTSGREEGIDVSRTHRWKCESMKDGADASGDT